jgi:DNA-binding beta-propeller fold protein YncE
MNRESFCTIILIAAALVLAPLAASAAEASKSDQTENVIISQPGVLPAAIFEMTDEPGHWFKDPKSGGSLVVIKPGEAVLIKVSAQTNTDHTITSLAWQPGAAGFPIDQEKPSNSSVTHTFEKPGLYVFTCKVHPYMFGAVIVDDPNTEGLDIGAELQLVTGAKIPTTTDIAKKLLRTYFVTTTPALWRDYRKPTWEVKLPDLPINLGGTVIKLSALDFSMPNTLLTPTTPGVGEVWVDTQFEGVTGKKKFGTATEFDASNWTVKQKVKGVETSMNNPHNMWSDPAYKLIYQTEWFDKKLTTFDRVSGKVYNSQVVGANPSHVMSSPLTGTLYVALNGEDRVLKLTPGEYPTALASINVGPHSGPHGHVITDDGKYMITPNALASSVSVVDLATEQMTEIPTGGVIPIAVWPGRNHKAYVANLLGTPPAMLSSMSVIDIDAKKKLKDIDLAEDYNPVSGEHKGEAYGLGPIQTPVSPDGKYVVTANFLSSTITILDTETDKVVKSLPCEPGCHGANFGLKKGGGYYAYVASKFANVVDVVDMDKLDLVGRILVDDPKDGQIAANNGMGGQGILPLPLADAGMLAPTLKLAGTGKLSPEVESWIKLVTKEQRGD